jgi:deoxyribonuclease-1
VRLLIFIVYLLVFTSNIYAVVGNTKASDFNSVTKSLLNKVYKKIPKKTVYCFASFNKNKIITNHNGYKYLGQGSPVLNDKIEWEHIVPAEFFGKKFDEWKIGDEKCISISTFKILGNRACAIKTNSKFKRMYTDLYNIYPAIARINRKRSNFKFKEGDVSISSISEISRLFFDDKLKREFGNCEFIINNKRAIPSNKSKGIIARAYLYMSSTYKNECRIYIKEKQLFQKWSKQYPVTKDECHRAKLISKLQGNHNKVVKKLCEKVKLYK